MPKSNFGNTQDLVAIEEIKNDTIVLRNGGFRQVLVVGGINFSLKSETEQNIITQAYQSFLNSLNFPVQIIIHSRKINIERYLKGLDGRKSEEPSGLLRDQIQEYQEFIRGFIHDNDIMSKTFFVVIPFVPTILPDTKSILGSIPFLGKSDAGAKATSEKERAHLLEESISQLSQRVGQVIEGINAIGLDAALLKDEGLIELFYNFYNPETTEKEELPLPKEQ